MKNAVVLLSLVGACLATGLAQAPVPGIAAPGADVPRVWHLGRVTGDLERIIRFYHDLLGLDLRGNREQARLFSRASTINEFVNAPPNAEYRAAFMPIQGTSAAVEAQDQIYLEAFEYRNINRHQIIPAAADESDRHQAAQHQRNLDSDQPLPSRRLHARSRWILPGSHRAPMKRVGACRQARHP